MISHYRVPLSKIPWISLQLLRGFPNYRAWFCKQFSYCSSRVSGRYIGHLEKLVLELVGKLFLRNRSSMDAVVLKWSSRLKFLLFLVWLNCELSVVVASHEAESKKRPAAATESSLLQLQATSSSSMITALVMGACTRCLMYVMLDKSNPKCPRCGSHVLLDFAAPTTPTAAAVKRQRVVLDSLWLNKLCDRPMSRGWSQPPQIRLPTN
jgi:hypothetical protein